MPLVLAGLLLAARADALPVSMTLGGEYSEGPGGRITRSALAVASREITPSMDVSLGVLRYGDSIIGDGTGVIGGVGFPVAAQVALRAWAYRYLGDHGFDAWRIKAGPLIGLPGQASLGLYYSHYSDHDNLAEAGIGELAVPLVPGIVGRASAAYASVGALQGSVGLGWMPFRTLELSGEMGLARDGAATASFPERRPVLPLLGGGSSTAAPSESASYAPSFLFGVRAMFR